MYQLSMIHRKILIFLCNLYRTPVFLYESNIFFVFYPFITKAKVNSYTPISFPAGLLHKYNRSGYLYPPVKILIYCHIILIISIHNFPINSFYFLCIFSYSSSGLYILHIIFSYVDDFKSVFCLFCIIYFVSFSVHFLISLPIQAVQQPIRLNKTQYFSFVKASNIFIVQSFR